MTDIEILETTYFDKCDIFRKVKQKNPNTGATETIDKLIVEDVKCSVSKKESVSNIVSGEIGSIVETHKLFISPNTDIKTGDIVIVTNSFKKQASYLASKPFYYISHMEIPITEKDRV